MKRARERKPTVAEELAALRVVLERIAVALESQKQPMWIPYTYPVTWPSITPTLGDSAPTPKGPTVTW